MEIRSIRVVPSASTLWIVLHSCRFSLSDCLSVLKIRISVCRRPWCGGFLSGSLVSRFILIERSVLIKMLRIWDLDLILRFCRIRHILLENACTMTFLFWIWKLFLMLIILYWLIIIHIISSNITSRKWGGVILIVIKLSIIDLLSWSHYERCSILLVDDTLFDFFTIFIDFILSCFRNHYQVDLSIKGDDWGF